MRMAKNSVAICLCGAMCIVGLFCGGNKANVAGNGSSSETVVGKVYATIIDSTTNLGVPGIPVVLVPSQFNPVKDSLSQFLYRSTDTSDGDGRIEITVPDTGSYTLTSTIDFYKYRLYLSSIIIENKDSLDLGDVYLHNPGTVLVNIDSATFTTGNSLIIPGTDIEQPVLSPGIIVLTTPSGIINVVYVDNGGDSISGSSFNDSVEVLPSTIVDETGIVETISVPMIQVSDSIIDINITDTVRCGGSTSNKKTALNYRFDWGDGTFSNWSAESTVVHYWTNVGTYGVRVKARSTLDSAIVSGWSTVCSVVVANPVPATDSVTDIDGNVYHTIKIGNQVWTVENFRTTRLNDGTAIPYVPDSAVWRSLTTPGYCYNVNTTDLDSIKKFGALYNWYAVSAQRFAPVGWHVPSKAEWDTLQNYLIVNGYNWDGTTTGNKIAKSLAAKTDWYTATWFTDTMAGVIGMDLTKNNRSGFSALPGNERSYIGFFPVDMGLSANWWSITEQDASIAYFCNLYYCYDYFAGYFESKGYGFSVRLVKDY